MRRILLVLFTCSLLAQRAAADCNWTTNIANINFGTYSVFGGSSLTATSSFQLTCTVGDTGRVTLSRGGSATFNPRKMARTTAPAANLNYNLYRDAATPVQRASNRHCATFQVRASSCGGGCTPVRELVAMSTRNRW